MKTREMLSLLIAVSLSFVLMFTLLIFCFSIILVSAVTGGIPFGVISCFVGTAYSTFYGGKGISHIYNQLSKRETDRKAEDILKRSNVFFNKQAIWFIATGAATVVSILLTLIF